MGRLSSPAAGKGTEERKPTDARIKMAANSITWAASHAQELVCIKATLAMQKERAKGIRPAAVERGPRRKIRAPVPRSRWEVLKPPKPFSVTQKKCTLAACRSVNVHGQTGESANGRAALPTRIPKIDASTVTLLPTLGRKEAVGPGRRCAPDLV